MAELGTFAGGEGVELAVRVDASEVLGAGEGAEESRPDEPDHGELRDATVRQLGLAEPLEVGHEVSLDVQGVVERREVARRESDGIEADVSREGAVEGVRARSEREGLRALDELHVEGRGGSAVARGGEGGGGAGEEGGGDDLHGWIGGVGGAREKRD